jgi:hypothetical protein
MLTITIWLNDKREKQMIQFTDGEGFEAFEIETEGGFSAFKMGIADKKQWCRHEETMQLKDYLDTKLQDRNFVTIKYQDSYIKVKK